MATYRYLFAIHVARPFAAKVERVPFFDYDCVAVREPQLVDWSELHRQLQLSLVIARNNSASSLLKPPPLSGRVFFRHRPRAVDECPLAVLNLALLHFYTAVQQEVGSEDREEVLAIAKDVADEIFRAFPVHQICSSRWPVFEVLELFELRLEFGGTSACDSIGNAGIIDWRSFRQAALSWADARLHEFVNPGEEHHNENMPEDLSEAMQQALQFPSAARDECFFGFTFAVGAVALSTATRLTQQFTDLAVWLDVVVRHNSFHTVASSGWPIFSSLAWLSDANKGKRFVKLNSKYGRYFGDLDLRAAELSPMAPPPGKGDVAASVWRYQGARRAALLGRLPQHTFRAHLQRRLRRGNTRPILRRALRAVLDLTRAPPGGGKRQKSLRLFGLILLYGSSWSPLFKRILQHMRNLGFDVPLLVVSIGKEAFAACRDVSRLSEIHLWPRVACWRPNTASQVHRFTIIHILLHLGIDVFYFDMDTFFFRNPLPTVLAMIRKQNLDTVFSSHADGDCINIGVFFISSSFRSATWFSRFLEYYHEHQYECDQRTLNIFLGFPLKSEMSKLGISFVPEDLPPIRASVLEDWNEFVIGWIGWSGEFSRIVCFHWCNIPLERKWQELNEVYDAAEAVERHMPVSVALSIVLPMWRAPFRDPSDPPPVAPSNASAPGGMPSLGFVWSLVHRARLVFEAYRLPSVTPRDICW